MDRDTIPMDLDRWWGYKACVQPSGTMMSCGRGEQDHVANRWLQMSSFNLRPLIEFLRNTRADRQRREREKILTPVRRADFDFRRYRPLQAAGRNDQCVAYAFDVPVSWRILDAGELAQWESLQGQEAEIVLTTSPPSLSALESYIAVMKPHVDSYDEINDRSVAELARRRAEAMAGQLAYKPGRTMVDNARAWHLSVILAARDPGTGGQLETIQTELYLKRRNFVWRVILFSPTRDVQDELAALHTVIASWQWRH